MTGPAVRVSRGLVPLLVVSGVVVLVAVGQAQGLWLANLHNGLLALAFTFVGAYVVFQRPGHREGLLFLATGVVESVVFAGRQLGSAPDGSRWWGWVGVWPVAIALAVTTVSVICFPDGRLPSARWRVVVAAVVALASACAALSAGWPVEYGSAGVHTIHPIDPDTPTSVAALWSALAHPIYIMFQVLWVVAVVARWRSTGGHTRRQLVGLVGAAGVSVVALTLGLTLGGTPTPGLLTATLVPIAAGWAIVHGQHVAAYSALSWLSRSGAQSSDLPADFARAVAESLAASGATLWIGGDELHAVGVWPERDQEIVPTTLSAMRVASHLHVQIVHSRGSSVGAISLDRPQQDALSLVEARLLDDLASQAALVVDHIGLGDLFARHRRAGRLDGLSPREQDVIELIAAGRSNAAICAELHLSVKTIESVITKIFTKLDLHPDTASNRRVLAVLAYFNT